MLFALSSNTLKFEVCSLTCRFSSSVWSYCALPEHQRLRDPELHLSRPPVSKGVLVSFNSEQRNTWVPRVHQQFEYGTLCSIPWPEPLQDNCQRWNKGVVHTAHRRLTDRWRWLLLVPPQQSELSTGSRRPDAWCILHQTWRSIFVCLISQYPKIRLSLFSKPSCPRGVFFLSDKILLCNMSLSLLIIQTFTKCSLLVFFFVRRCAWKS